MANLLKTEIVDEVRLLFLKTGSIRSVASGLSISRNTVRSIIRREGLTIQAVSSQNHQHQQLEPTFTSLPELDFTMLEKMFGGTQEPNAAKDFEKHIRSMTLQIAQEIGVRGRLDTVRLEAAICQYIQYRRFFFRSLDASDKDYCGPFKKYHEKTAKAVDSWVSASNKAFDQMNRLLRELEVKYGKRVPDLGRNNVFVQNQQVNVGSER